MEDIKNIDLENAMVRLEKVVEEISAEKEDVTSVEISENAIPSVEEQEETDTYLITLTPAMK